MEGAVPLNRPTIFNYDNYVNWKMRMIAYIRSNDLKAWLVIKNGPNVHMKEEDGKMVPKKGRRVHQR